MFKSESKLHTDNVGSLNQWDRSKLWSGVLIDLGRSDYLEPGIFWKQHNSKNPGARWTLHVLSHENIWYNDSYRQPSSIIMISTVP